MRTVLLVGAALWAFSLTGCDIYFGPSSESDCGVFEPCDDRVWPDEPPPGAPGGVCGSDYDCNAGCFCDFGDAAAGDPNAQGTCVETGFCESAGDCPLDFQCQLDRATCVPEQLDPPPPPPPADCSMTGCPLGTRCDATTGECVPSDGCTVDTDCGPGFECDANGTCQPMACDSDDDCLAGCACDTDTGICEETGFCMVDADCTEFCNADGECFPMVCDERNTCTFGESPLSTCGGPLTCAQPAPLCADGETAEVVDGCYTGNCLLIADCSDTPLATCDRIQNPNQCINRLDCAPYYDGLNCVCDETTLDCDQPDNWTCESYEYAGCESI